MTDERSWLQHLEVTSSVLSPGEQVQLAKANEATRRHNAAVARLERRGEVPTVGCAQHCTTHRGHVYVLCYGEPVRVGDSDVNVGGTRMSEPISHYVGFTGGRPGARIERHGEMSRYCTAEIRPGTLLDEVRMKVDSRCVHCGSALRYWEESPYWRHRYVRRLENLLPAVASRASDRTIE